MSMSKLAESQRLCTATAERDGSRARLCPTGTFDLASVPTIKLELDNAERELEGCMHVELDLERFDKIDGAGAVLLARLVDRLDASGGRVRVVEGGSPQAARLRPRSRHRAIRSRDSVRLPWRCLRCSAPWRASPAGSQQPFQRQSSHPGRLTGARCRT